MNETRERLTWDEIVSDAVVAEESDKVRQHSRDDFGLGPGWVFAGGRHYRQAGRVKWFTLWILPRPEFRAAVEPWLSDGLGSVEVIRWDDGSWHVVAHSRIYIGQRRVELEEPPPEKLQQFFSYSKPGQGYAELPPFSGVLA